MCLMLDTIWMDADLLIWVFRQPLRGMLPGTVPQPVYIGSQAVFFKINTWGEDAFLDTIRDTVEQFT